MDYDSVMKMWEGKLRQLDAELATLQQAYAELQAANADEERLDCAECDISYLQHRRDGLNDAINILLSTTTTGMCI